MENEELNKINLNEMSTDEALKILEEKLENIKTDKDISIEDIIKSNNERRAKIEEQASKEIKSELIQFKIED